ncbi:MAG: hypothetical protein BWZ03_00336 [bacterium ADurb.BinA186]|nr:MAG: hypothetical protein BWZ03_00336 [bacterium ADurb.BinA186]
MKFVSEKVKDLHFDLQNPRLVECGIKTTDGQDEILEILWKAMDAKEIAMSIVANGYFQNDPLIVAEESGQKIVIEGNRRLAALKALLNRDALLKKLPGIPEVTPEILAGIKEVPVTIQSREDSWKFLGFKHVNGPAKWGSYAKARYIAKVKNDYGVSLDQIGKQIGDTHRTVEKLYRRLMVIEQAEQHGVFSREDVKRGAFAFSHIYTGLQREGIQSFLGIQDGIASDQAPIPEDKIKELGELCRWLYGSKKDEVDPVVLSQNPHLKQLDRVLQNREGISALRANRPLEEAFEQTRPSGEIFEEELLAVKRSLMKAKSLSVIAFKGETDLLKIAGTVAELADALYNEMERKYSGGKKTRITE